MFGPLEQRRSSGGPDRVPPGRINEGTSKSRNGRWIDSIEAADWTPGGRGIRSDRARKLSFPHQLAQGVMPFLVVVRLSASACYLAAPRISYKSLRAKSLSGSYSNAFRTPASAAVAFPARYSATARL